MHAEQTVGRDNGSLRDRFESLVPVNAFARKAGEFMSPNQWTASRVPLAGITLALNTISREAATVSYTINALLDYMDGMVARGTKQTSKQGAVLDPLADKIVNGTTALYLSAYSLDPYFSAATVLSLAVDYNSQRQRGPILEQLEMFREVMRKRVEIDSTTETTSALQANVYGKLKTILQSIAITCMLWDTKSSMIAAGILGASVASGYIGTKIRERKKANQASI